MKATREQRRRDITSQGNFASTATKAAQTPFPHNPDPAPHHTEKNPGQFKPARQIADVVDAMHDTITGYMRKSESDQRRIAELEAALQAFVYAADRGATTFFDMKGSCLSKARAALLGQK